MDKWANCYIPCFLVEFSVFVLGETGDNCMVFSSFLKSTKYLIALTFWEIKNSDQRSYY